MKKRGLSIILLLLITTLTFVGCSNEKDIEVKKDVIGENMVQDSKNKLYECKETIDINNKEFYFPSGFINDDNLILIKVINNFEKGVFYYNLNNKKLEKVKGIGEVNYESNIFNNKIINIIDNKAYLFDIKTNENTEIYNLKSEGEKIAAYAIKNSDKYILITFSDKDNQTIRNIILDKENKKEYKINTLPYNKDVRTLVYSKALDMFYYANGNGDLVATNPINNKDSCLVTEEKTIFRSIQLSEDGKKMYTIGFVEDKENYIGEINLGSKKVKKILENKQFKESGKGRTINRLLVCKDNFIYTNNGYREDNGGKAFSDEVFTGQLINGEISNINRVTYPGQVDIYNNDFLTLTEDGEKVIRATLQYKNKDNLTKDKEYKYFLYNRIK